MDSSNSQNSHHHGHHICLQWLTLVVCVAILLVAVYYTVGNIASLHRQGYMHRYQTRQQGAANLYIRSWMTFSFINQQFNLPANYLKDTLKITAKNYPKVSLSSVASAEKKTSPAIILEIENAIKNYRASQQPQQQ